MKCTVAVIELFRLEPRVLYSFGKVVQLTYMGGGKLNR